MFLNLFFVLRYSMYLVDCNKCMLIDTPILNLIVAHEFITLNIFMSNNYVMVICSNARLR